MKENSLKLKNMTEQQLQINISNYIKLQYPHVLFFSEPSGIFIKSWQQRKNLKAMRSTNGKLPDMFIAEPVGEYSGLFIELKKEGVKIFGKNGEPATKHISEQRDTLLRLSNKGYFAAFASGFEEAKNVIDNYLKIPK